MNSTNKWTFQCKTGKKLNKLTKIQEAQTAKYLKSMLTVASKAFSCNTWSQIVRKVVLWPKNSFSTTTNLFEKPNYCKENLKKLHSTETRKEGTHGASKICINSCGRHLNLRHPVWETRFGIWVEQLNFVNIEQNEDV